MKKTLKILMAIILFAVVLTIATSVNAATLTKGTNASLNAIIDAEKDADVVNYEDGYYKVKAALTEPISGTIVIPANETVYLDLAADVAADIKVSGKLVLSGSKKITGTVENNGTLEIKVATAKPTTVKNNGTVYADVAVEFAADELTNKGMVYSIAATKATVATADADKVTDLTLKTPVKVGEKEYDTLLVLLKDIEKDITYKAEVCPVGGLTPVSKIEEGEDYTVKVKAFYKGAEITNGVTLSAGPLAAGASANCQVDAADNTKITVEKKLSEGATVILTAQLTGVDATKRDLPAIPVGEEIKNEDQKPEDPNQPAQPEEPAKPSDDKKGDLDDAAAVATGDHIIPATALLAVVVVANVVYFAKSKNN